MEDSILVWEGEGGSLSEALSQRMTGSVDQIEWAERIRAQVNGEFDRVAKALQAAALKQSDQDRLNTYEMMLILEEKRGEVLSNERAGYFIRDWQELRDQVRKMIMNDARYKAIKERAPSN
jgi:DNA-binding ferritin-like protein